jgi:hypothetical protein
MVQFPGETNGPPAHEGPHYAPGMPGHEDGCSDYNEIKDGVTDQLCC